jgi:hypothetical protein
MRENSEKEKWMAGEYSPQLTEIYIRDNLEMVLSMEMVSGLAQMEFPTMKALGLIISETVSGGWLWTVQVIDMTDLS